MAKDAYRTRSTTSLTEGEYIASQKDHPEAHKYRSDQVAKIAFRYFRLYFPDKIPGNVRIFLVGSRARGTNRLNSDWDVVIDTDIYHEQRANVWLEIATNINRRLRKENIPIEVNIEPPEKIFQLIGLFS